MANKSTFTAEEWDALRAAPFLASLVVVSASPSGPIGLIQESAAAGKMLLEEAKSGKSELMKALAADLVESRSTPKLESHDPDKVRAAGLDACRKAAQLVKAKASAEEAGEFRAWLNAMAKKVAEASKEGGFLGFGGTLVSSEEEAALRDIAAALEN